jgi:hypothetical protein
MHCGHEWPRLWKINALPDDHAAAPAGAAAEEIITR